MENQTEAIVANEADIQPAVVEESKRDVPLDRIAGLKQNWRYDLVSGFILFLIALPLSLGIARASGVPPMAGLIAAIVGGMFVSQTSGSFVTINGPAAGLIVVILGTVDRLGGGDVGYHCALAAIIVSGVFLFLGGLVKAGKLGEFFPASVVHGMLAAIGCIIMIKEIPDFVGVKAPAKEPLMLLTKIPDMLTGLNPDVAVIGFGSLAILIVYNLLKGPKWLKKIPAPIIVVLYGLALSAYFNFGAVHDYVLGGHNYHIEPTKILVTLPANVAAGIAFPDWSKVASGAFWFSVLSITLVQGVETLLSCAAVDKLDPWQRKSNLSRDVAAVGAATAVSGAIGGVPMIAEIVRSTANVMAGARTRWSNFFHGTLILLFLVFASQLIDHIPLACLAALLIVTGYRLASPPVWKKTHEIGAEQTIVFTSTVIGTLATDLLCGVGIGIVVKYVIHVINGFPIQYTFKAPVAVTTSGDTSTVIVRGGAIFSNWLSIKGQLDKLPREKHVIVDLGETRLVDHTVMERLHDYQTDYQREGGTFIVEGLARHKAISRHPKAARKSQQELSGAPAAGS